MNIYPYLGNNVDPVNIKELGYRGLLQEGETLLAIFDGMLIDDRGRRVGGVSLTDFVALTDQRLITWARGFFNDMVDGFQWKDVDVVEAKTWDPLHGRVSLAFRLLPEVPRSRRITVKGFKTSSKPVETGERIIINTLDYMPAADVPVLAEMVEWIGDQVVAGVTGDELLAAFADMFPLPEVEPSPPHVAPQPQQQVIESSSSKRSSWWGVGNQENPEERKLENIDSPDKLIAAYELQRMNDSPLSVQNVPPMRSTGMSPFGHFGFYDVSRGVRLLFEGPRRMGGSLNRVNDVLIDTAELIEDLQDPQMRKRTLSGLRYAINMQEGQPGLLGAVAPVVRAVLGSGSGGLHDSSSHHHGESDGERPGVRRIQVRAAVRQRDPGNPRPMTNVRPDADVAMPEIPLSVNRESSSSAPKDSDLGDVRIPSVSARAKVRQQINTHKRGDSTVGGNVPANDSPIADSHEYAANDTGK